MSITQPSTDIFDEVAAGIWDEGLDALLEAVVARRDFVRAERGARNQMEFKHGTSVRIINIKPKYLGGITGKVNKDRMPERRGDLMVDIDPQCYRRLGRYPRVLAVPSSSLEEVK
jgi:hypothetical protein